MADVMGGVERSIRVRQWRAQCSEQAHSIVQASGIQHSGAFVLSKQGPRVRLVRVAWSAVTVKRLCTAALKKLPW
jgi:hypothetical protein